MKDGAAMYVKHQLTTSCIGIVTVYSSFFL